MATLDFLTSSNSSTFSILIALLAVTGGYLLHQRRRLPLPPGPKRLPIVGNALDYPTETPWVKYAEWSRDYGSDVVYAKIFNTSMVILNSEQAINDLFVKRSAIYSDRPRHIMVNELMGWSRNLHSMTYGDEWRAGRRLFHQEFNPGASKRFRPHMLAASRELLVRLLKDSDDFVEHIRHLSGSVSMDIAYGMKAQEKDDPFIACSERAVAGVVRAFVPGAFLVDMIPILKYVPEWVPGAGFQRLARQWKKETDDTFDLPWAAAKQRIALGSFTSSFTSFSLDQLTEKNASPEAKAKEEVVVKNTAASMFLVGSDTNIAPLQSVFLGVLSNPEALQKAQQELDRVLGAGTLPDFSHQEDLPYVTALVKEVLRWHDPAPISLTHRVTEEDVYKGYRIPKGSYVVSNLWALMHDPEVYTDPMDFKPERFLRPDGTLNPDIRDPRDVIFGIGRRYCPGRYAAYDFAWIAIASLLTVFNVKRSLNENGVPIEPTYEYTSTVISVPLPFKCAIKPRSAEAEKLIMSMEGL
ncbi:cytochrome P450 [Lentinula aciculospora]|uniref:Cytochrome P450 n=1 Tax=Lentinula aciculospora TaxID=153920 RepID=A0A9W8ZWZ7_9AGAR|nr:cytochrome P450 [Lentinula aciculospora]